MKNEQIINRKITLSETLKKIICEISATYQSLAVIQKLYVNALLFLLLYSLFPKIINLELDIALLSIFLVFWVSAISYDMLNIYKKTYKSLVGKVILLLLLTIFTNVAISLSAQVVNEVTGVNPSSFPHTQTILAILMIPLLAVGVGGILLFGALILSPLILMFHITDDEFKKFIIPGYSKDNKLNFQKTTRIIQFVSSIAFVGFIIGLSQKASGSYSAFVSDTARLYIYNMEMYSKAPCAIEGGGKFVFIGEEKILLGIKNSSGIDFKLEECKTKF